MMKRFLLFAATALLVMLTGCKEEIPEGTPAMDITGEWALADISTKAAAIGSQTVSAYVSFTEEGKFELYQQLGQGWYSRFTGTWTLTEETLSGSYDGGRPWGSSYTVTLSDNTMTLTTASGSETDTYVRTPIPDEVKNKTWLR